jgi:hypothetical protein
MKRVTISFSPKLDRALNAKAAANNKGLSELVNEVVQFTLREDALDEEAYRRRKAEPSGAFSTIARRIGNPRLS